jgi:diacylglycerol kinase (ATP)
LCLKIEEKLKRKIAFIINPISGGINKNDFPGLVHQYLDVNKFEPHLFFTQSTEHNKQLAKACVDQQYDIIIAVGGDGTINNTAAAVVGSPCIFGIIPQGSGNGLARHLNISSNVVEALKIINQSKYATIDTGIANGVFFINVAGVGFDAHVSWLFAQAPKRGFWQYAKITFKQFAQYKPRTYQLNIDGKHNQVNAFIICAANGSQYGNNAYIAPLAIINDGEFEITIIKPFNIFQAIPLAYHLFNKTLHKSSRISILSGKHITINRGVNEVMNIDGEACETKQQIDISMNPASLKVIVP